MSEYAAMSPPEIDGQLAVIYREMAALEHKVATGASSCHYAIGENKVRLGRAMVWPSSDVEAIAEARRQYEAGETPFSYRSSMAGILDRIDTAAGEHVKLAEQAAGYEAEHDARGWSRFFIVPDGHIHRSMNCSTCNNGIYATKFGWLPEVSGKSEAEAVAEHGALLCTVCFPSAPVEWTNGREVEAAAKAADKCPGKRDYDAPSRTGFYSGNWATCDTCKGRITVTTTGKLRAHKPAA